MIMGGDSVSARNGSGLRPASQKSSSRSVYRAPFRCMIEPFRPALAESCDWTRPSPSQQKNMSTIIHTKILERRFRCCSYALYRFCHTWLFPNTSDATPSIFNLRIARICGVRRYGISRPFSFFFSLLSWPRFDTLSYNIWG
jgi:hypothetical protein